MGGPYLNDDGYEIPDNTIVVVPMSVGDDGRHKEVVESLIGNTKRDWFNPHFYYCLPLTIGNQYGFIVKSLRDLDAIWGGGERPVDIEFLDTDVNDRQSVVNHFNNGVITFQNHFSLRTPRGVNLMTVQPPNMYIPGCVSMTGVIETDNIRRDFTFNIKVTVPNYKISIRKGDVIGAFIPISRGFVDDFKIKEITEIFSSDIHSNELQESSALGKERSEEDFRKPHGVGRRYFKGLHIGGSSYRDHQKTVKF